MLHAIIFGFSHPNLHQLLGHSASSTPGPFLLLSDCMLDRLDLLQMLKYLLPEQMHPTT